MGQALQHMQQSMKAAKAADHARVEDNVDSLIKRLEMQGKKIKIIEDNGDNNDDGDDYSSPEVKRKKKGKRAKQQSEEDGSDDDDEAAAQKQRELEEIMKQKETLDQDKQRIADELMQKEQLLQREAEEKMTLEDRIREMEQKLVNGG